ncbi:hypothetical protein [Salmonella bongori]|uniref:hypothetical protein n=1 Tax=Salmonella bongori TaxID=54736 RepID=UPI0015EC36B8|nr:hypothetical protein [Salmonella bongori]MBA3226388.1 hypothetical protein [Salmonella bongori]
MMIAGEIYVGLSRDPSASKICALGKNIIKSQCKNMTNDGCGSVAGAIPWSWSGKTDGASVLQHAGIPAKVLGRRGAGSQINNKKRYAGCMKSLLTATRSNIRSHSLNTD